MKAIGVYRAEDDISKQRDVSSILVHDAGGMIDLESQASRR